MSSQSSAFYEEKFRGCVMQRISEGRSTDLKSFQQQLIDENKKEYATINSAYLKVKKELLG